MSARNLLFTLLFCPIVALGQPRTNKTWQDTMLKSEFSVRYDEGKGHYLFNAEKYARDGEFGTLAKGSVTRLQQVVYLMDSAFQSKDPEKLFALGRFKYSYKKISVKDLIDVEVLKVEDLLKDDSGKKPLYMMSAGTLSGIKEFVTGITD